MMTVEYKYCPNCNAVVINFSAEKVKQLLCDDCLRYQEPRDHDRQAFHRRMICCPRCEHWERVEDFDVPAYYEKGLHEIICENCKLYYSFETEITYTFWSPRVKRSEDNGQT